MKSTSKIAILKPGDEALLEAFLLPRIEASMFLVGNLRASGLLDHGQAYSGTYAAAFGSGEITGVVAHYWNQISSSWIWPCRRGRFAVGCARKRRREGNPVYRRE